MLVKVEKCYLKIRRYYPYDDTDAGVGGLNTEGGERASLCPRKDETREKGGSR